MEVFRLFGSIFLNSADVNKQLDSVDKKASGVGTTLGSTIGTAAKWGAGITAGLVAAGGSLVAFASKAADTASQINDMSERTGLSTDRLQELQYATKMVGVSFESITGAVGKLTKSMDASDSGNKDAMESFKKLGISVSDSNGHLRTMDDIFPEVIKKLADMKDPTERNALALKLFGKGAMELVPLLNQGSDSISKMQTEAHRLGIVLSKESIDAGDKFGDSMDALKLTFSAVVAEIGLKVIPHVQKLVDYIIKNIPEIKKTIGDVFDKYVMPIFTKFGNAVTFAKDMLNLLLPVIAGVTAAFIAYNVAIKAALIIQTLTKLMNQYWAMTELMSKGVKFATAMQMAFNVSLAANPIGLVVIALAALVGIAVVVVKNWKTVGPFFQSVWKLIKSVFTTYIAGIMVEIRALQYGVAVVLSAVLGNVTKLVSSILGVFAKIPKIGGAFAEAKKGVDALTDGLTAFKNSAKKSLDEAVTSVKNNTLGIATSLSEVGKAGADMGKGIGEGIGNAMNSAKKLFTSGTSEMVKSSNKAKTEIVNDSNEAAETQIDNSDKVSKAQAAHAKEVEKAQAAKEKALTQAANAIKNSYAPALQQLTSHIKTLLVPTNSLVKDLANQKHAMEDTKKEISILTEEYNKMVKLKGKNAAESLAIKQKIDDETIAYKTLGNQVAATNEKIKESNQKLYDKSLASLNQLGDAIKQALKAQYEAQRKTDLKEAEKKLNIKYKPEIAANQKLIKELESTAKKESDLLDESAYNTKISELEKELLRLQGARTQQELLEDVTEIENRELKKQEYNNEVSTKYQAILDENDAERKKELSIELDDFKLEHERESVLEQRQMQIETLNNTEAIAEKQKEIENLKSEHLRESLDNQRDMQIEAYQKNIEDLQAASENELKAKEESINAQYDELSSEENLQERARLMLLDPNSTAVVNLLKKYNPQWQNVGQSIGESILEGFNSTKETIKSAVNEVLGLAPVTEAIKENKKETTMAAKTSTTTAKPTTTAMKEAARTPTPQNATTILSLTASQLASAISDATTQLNAQVKAMTGAGVPNEAIRKELGTMEQSILMMKAEAMRKSGAPDSVIKQLTGYADGTNSASPGWKWTGEEGPELINFHGGEKVIPNDKIGGITVNINNPVLLDRRNVDVLGDLLVSTLRLKLGVV